MPRACYRLRPAGPRTTPDATTWPGSWANRGSRGLSEQDEYAPAAWTERRPGPPNSPVGLQRLQAQPTVGRRPDLCRRLVRRRLYVLRHRRRQHGDTDGARHIGDHPMGTRGPPRRPRRPHRHLQPPSQPPIQPTPRRDPRLSHPSDRPATHTTTPLPKRPTRYTRPNKSETPDKTRGERSTTSRFATLGRVHWRHNQRIHGHLNDHSADHLKPPTLPRTSTTTTNSLCEPRVSQILDAGQDGPLARLRNRLGHQRLLLRPALAVAAPHQRTNQRTAQGAGCPKAPTSTSARVNSQLSNTTSTPCPANFTTGN